MSQSRALKCVPNDILCRCLFSWCEKCWSILL